MPNTVVDLDQAKDRDAWCLKNFGVYHCVFKIHANWFTTDHEWANDESGYVDIFAYDYPGHNGPRCVKCGYSDCWHCHRKPPPCPGEKKR